MALVTKNTLNRIINLENKKLTPKKAKWFGIILAILAAVFAGTINVVGKTLVDPQNTDIESLNPINLALVVGLIAGLFFTPLAKNQTSPRKIDKKTLIFILLLGVSEVAATTTNFFGLAHTTATNASILSNTEFIFAILIAIMIFHERLHKKEYLPLAMILGGAIVIPLSLDLQENNFSLDKIVFGDFLILLAALFYAIDISIARFVSRRAPVARISQISAFAGVPFALLLILIFQVPFDIQVPHIPSILFMGIFVTGLGYYFFVLALRFLGAIRTILIYSTTTVFGVMFAGIFLGEQITLFDVSALGIVIFGVYLLRSRLAKMEE
ncbi:MAG: DMT family transporter [Nitrosopumilaceae archaeon]|nr:DMT family transporter [Nitrosopumilaceae archaeon]